MPNPVFRSTQPLALLLALGIGGVFSYAQEPPAIQDSKGKASESPAMEWPPLPPEARAKQSITLGNRTLNYTVTVGALPILDEKGKKIAEVVCTSYVLEGSNPQNRPVTFVLNGGPGSSSVWLNLGALGPKRIQFGTQGDNPSDPVVLKDNPGTWMDFTDLVFIDPVGTGYSRALVNDEEAKKRFYTVKTDIAYLSRIIYDWLCLKDRMASPKYLVGESYGGFRVPRLAATLQVELGVGLSGLVMVSPYLDGQSTHGIEHLRLHVPSPYPRWEGVTARAMPQAAKMETFRMDGDRDGESEIITAYPVARDGALHPLTLHQARPWKVGCEAIVIASTAFGASIAYFDTCFLHPWNEWCEDDEMEVSLAAFAYSLEPAPVQVIPITQEDKVRAMRAMEQGITPEEVSDLSPIEIRTKGMACLFSHQGGNPDEFDFQGPVVGVDILRAWGQTLYRLEVTVMRDTTGEETLPFTIPVYVAQHKLPEGYRPRVGDDVQGVLWLQGSVAGLKFPVISEG